MCQVAIRRSLLKSVAPGDRLKRVDVIENGARPGGATGERVEQRSYLTGPEVSGLDLAGRGQAHGQYVIGTPSWPATGDMASPAEASHITRRSCAGGIRHGVIYSIRDSLAGGVEVIRPCGAFSSIRSPLSRGVSCDA